MGLIVKKFGGSSVGTTEKILNVAKRILAEKQPEDQIVMVVSAMGDTTDDLIALAKQIDEEPYRYEREMDMLLTTGEQVSIALLTMAFRSLGQKAISLTGAQAGIHTNSVHTKGKIVDIQPQRVLDELQAGNIVIVAGFQGADALGDPVTLGRGGSDTSAVALAGALKADSCEIYTDVDGIYSADPRVEPDARRMKEITYTGWEEIFTYTYTYDGDNRYPATELMDGQACADLFKSTTKYRYTRFDDLGNWLEREAWTTEEQGVDSGDENPEMEVTKKYTIEVREITYYH